ncbi:hypothetical protein [Trichococcus shcherbakoviae]|uniref:Uncharacterized protein n=1 Tax=Trichococcus shcherbakoviae subsp. psychrophilus TaxID=2585775 RepID=A0A5C5E7A1_9LACT|nr:hypothetical protein [Trichococcus shcherbakoviae]TNV68914.1 hypothetical protein FHK04_05165 [Trichococcus shcherbakoviae subsp. psychrophilus]
MNISMVLGGLFGILVYGYFLWVSVNEITYENLARNPEDFEGERLLLSGEVVQVIQGDSETSLRFAVGSNSDSVVLVHYDSSIAKNRILVGDYVSIEAISEGLHTYTSALAGNITIPMLYVSMIEIQ